MRKEYVEDNLIIRVVATFNHPTAGETSFIRLGKYGFGVHFSEFGLVVFDNYYSAAYRYNAYAEEVNGDLCVPLDELDFDIIDKLWGWKRVKMMKLLDLYSICGNILPNTVIEIHSYNNKGCCFITSQIYSYLLDEQLNKEVTYFRCLPDNLVIVHVL